MNVAVSPAPAVGEQWLSGLESYPEHNALHGGVIAADDDNTGFVDEDDDSRDNDPRLQWFGDDYDGADYDNPLSPDALRDFGYDTDDDRATAATGHRNAEFCQLCGWPLNLKWAWKQCEFPDAPTGELCHCNGCLGHPIRSRGHQPQYCGKDCADRMKYALRRAKRRAASGNASRTNDPEADRIADYRMDMAKRARQRKDDDARYVVDWQGVWTFPWWRSWDSGYSMHEVSDHIWMISGPPNLHTGRGRNVPKDPDIPRLSMGCLRNPTTSTRFPSSLRCRPDVRRTSALTSIGTQ